MELEYYSASRIKSISDCKKYFYHRYVLKDMKDESNPYAKLGTALHSVLEEWRPEPTADVKTLVASYKKHMDKDNAWVYSDGRRILMNLNLNKLICGELVGVELAFEETIEGFPIVGVIDKVEKLEDGTLLVTDYKSNQKMETVEYLPQLAVYDLAMEHLYPGSKRIMSLFYLRYNKEFRFSFTEETRKRILKSFESTRVAVFEKHDDPTFWEKMPSKGKNCSYCPLQKECW